MMVEPILDLLQLARTALTQSYEESNSSQRHTVVKDDRIIVLILPKAQQPYGSLASRQKQGKNEALTSCTMQLGMST